MLGFPELSRLCGELEEACKSGRDLPMRFERAKAAAQAAAEQTRTSLAHLRSSSAGAV
jgi:hypothetical protein